MSDRERQRRRVAAVLRVIADERAVSERLGYAPRPDHPWSAPLNKATPSGFQAEDGGCLRPDVGDEDFTL